MDIELTVVTAESDNTTIDGENACAICLEEMVALDTEDIETGSKGKDKSLCKLKCGHEYHFHCITPVVVNSFLERKDIICPMCRNVECSTTTPLYRASYQSLIELVRQERRQNILQIVRMDGDSDANTTPSSNNNIPIRYNTTGCWNKKMLSCIPLVLLLMVLLILMIRNLVRYA